MFRPLLHPRIELTDTLERIYSYKMTTTSGGNLSIRDETGDVWITPARVDKGSLRREDIVCIKPDGRVEGLHKPSSEHPFHQAIYKVRPDLGAVVHAHPVALVAFSICRQAPDTRLFPQAWHVCGQIGFAPYALPGSAALGENIARTFAGGANCVILENHGVAVGGRDLQEAFQRFETLEFTAKTIIKAGILTTAGAGPASPAVRYLSEAQVALAERPRADLPPFTPGPATTAEKALRQQLVDFLRRGYRQRLLTSTEGSFSARLDDRSFLISCYRVDRKTVSLDELALVHDGRVEAGKSPSRAVRIHAALYRRHPGVQAVLNAMPVNATAFSVTGAPLDARTIPESYLFLRDVATIPYADQFGDGEAVADRVNPRTPAALMENNGVLVVGTSVLDAFDRLEVLESTAEAIINARPVAPVRPMEAHHIDTLKGAFGLD
jgi:L-fuculose-phosphate aldolase